MELFKVTYKNNEGKITSFTKGFKDSQEAVEKLDEMGVLINGFWQIESVTRQGKSKIK